MLATIAIIISSIFVLLFAINHFFGNRELYKKTSHIPGPLTFPLIGSGYLFIGDTSPLNILRQLSKLGNTYGSPCRLIVGPKVFIIIHDSKHIKRVFLSSKTTEKHEIYDFVRPWLGNGLVTAPRDVWRVHRKLIQPAFVPKILHSFVSIFQKTSILLMDEWAEQVDQPEFEVQSYLSFTSFRGICESSLGMPVTTKNIKSIEQYMESSERVFQVAFQRPAKPWLYSETIFKMTAASKVFYKSVNLLKSFTMNVIEKRRIYLKSKSFLNEDEGEKKAFLDLMLEMTDDGHFTDEEVRQHSDTMIEGGFDTVSRVNSFALLMLASHPDIQDKVYEELYQIYGSENPDERPVEFEDLKKLEYLERVIKETMRIFPPVPILARKLLEDCCLDGYNLPKGCGIVVSVFALHRNEKYWPDPLKFDPDRFLPEIDERRTPYCYMPFSLGPRNCIGNVYAMISMKILLATLLRKYVVIKDQITPVKDIKIKSDVLLEAAEPVTIRIKKRVK